MDYNNLLELCIQLGYDLAMSGAETYRVEDTIMRIMATYGIAAEVFAIPNNLLVSIETDSGKPMTRMRRIGFHGNDLDAVEKFNGLSRRICAEKPDPTVAMEWLKQIRDSRSSYSLWVLVFASMISAGGYAVFFGGGLIDFVCALVCGLFVGFVNYFMNKLKANPFFSTAISAFVMAFIAYGMGALHIAPRTDSIIIGTLMILVPGLIFVNAMRDIIYGDTNAGINRIMQVLLIAAAIALGTGAAFNATSYFWSMSASLPRINYPLWIQCISAAIGCIGFTVLFNIHGRGMILCILGGGLTWAVYGITFMLTQSEVGGYFAATLFAASYAEIMARIRKYPAISYLVVSIFPLIPGAGIYYATNHLVAGDLTAFTNQCSNTVSIAGAIAVGILIVSTIVRFRSILQKHRLH